MITTVCKRGKKAGTLRDAGSANLADSVSQNYTESNL